MGSELVIRAFDSLSPDINDIYDGANGYNLDDWRLLQQSLVTASGAASAIIPVLHLFGMAADLGFLMNRMSVCAYGIGAILGTKNGHGNFLEQEDFAMVLALWAGEDGIKDAAIGKAAASAVGKVGSKAFTKVLAKTMCEKAGILIGKKLGSKLAVKLGAKFGAKLATKAVGGFIPFFGAGIGAGINLWFLSSIAESAEAWYRTKLSA